MANYRREISKYEQKDVHSKYRDLVDKDGGIFTKDKRRKLLGLKQEHGKNFQNKEDSWKALLAEDIVNICMEFFMKRNLISTKAHLRLVEELQDMLDVEVSRTFYLKRDQRTKGHV